MEEIGANSDKRAMRVYRKHKIAIICVQHHSRFTDNFKFTGGFLKATKNSLSRVSGRAFRITEADRTFIFDFLHRRSVKTVKTSFDTHGAS